MNLFMNEAFGSERGYVEWRCANGGVSKGAVGAVHDSPRLKPGGWCIPPIVFAPCKGAAIYVNINNLRIAVPLQGTNGDEDKRPGVETPGYYAKRLQRFSTQCHIYELEDTGETLRLRNALVSK